MWLAAAWWTSLSLLGFVVVPLLFVHLPTPSMAGAMAAHLVGAQAWVSCVCAGLLVVLNGQQRGLLVFPRNRQAVAWLVLVASLGFTCALLAQWVVAPRIVAREDLQIWHRLGSAMYLVQWLCSVAVFQMLVRRIAGRASSLR